MAVFNQRISDVYTTFDITDLLTNYMKKTKLLTSIAFMSILAACSQPKVSVTWIEDKPGPTMQNPQVFANVPDSLLTELGLTEGIPSSMSVFLMQVDDWNVLFDAGLGAPFSQLLPALEAKGVKPADVDYVYITHMHGDHIGGLLKDGQPVFTSADIYVNRVEADAWLAMPQERSAQVKNILDAYGDHVKYFDAGDELPLGVKSIAAYGHTPGHTCYQKDDLLFIADILHGAALQLEHPEYCPFYDMDAEQATKSRMAILKYAKDNGLIMYGHHLPSPGYIVSVP